MTLELTYWKTKMKFLFKTRTAPTAKSQQLLEQLLDPSG